MIQTALRIGGIILAWWIVVSCASAAANHVRGDPLTALARVRLRVGWILLGLAMLAGATLGLALTVGLVRYVYFLATHRPEPFTRQSGSAWLFELFGAVIILAVIIGPEIRRRRLQRTPESK